MDSPEIDIPPFKATSLDEIPQRCARVATTFRSGYTKDVEWRKVQLRKAYWAITDYTPQLAEALLRDLNKCKFEAMISEIDFIKNDCIYLLSQLDKLTADEKLKSPEVPVTFALASLRLRKEPLGAVLIIGAYNYPVTLTLGPLLGAIAAGCTAVLKPSELAPATAMVVQKMLEDRLDNDAFQVVNGAVPETTALLDFRDVYATRHASTESADVPRGWAKIVYTGGRSVARIVSAKAATTLTPVLLELGGLNPAFVTAKTPDIALAARRLLWGKTLGAGQVCLSQNYVLVERSVVDDFIQGLQTAFQISFPSGAQNSQLVHIINERHFLRLKSMLDQTQGRIVMGGQMDQKTLFMEPTAVLVDSVDDPLIQQESFGPIFSILPVDDVSDAIRIANEVDPTPLALYTFGSQEENNRILREVNSGGATINDSFLHGSLSTVPFGGIGHSGTGAYHGRASFDAFTHNRTVAATPGWMDRFLRVRYMPYDWREMRILTLTAPNPNFNRDGQVVRGLGYWLRLLLSLGSRNGRGVFLRWLGCAAILMAVLGKHQNQGLLTQLWRGEAR